MQETKTYQNYGKTVSAQMTQTPAPVPPTVLQINKTENGETGKTPEKRFGSGSINVAVWKNTATKNDKISEYRTVTFQRRYNKDGEWKSTNSLRTNDLPKVTLALQKAYEYLVFEAKDEAEAPSS